VSVVGLRLATYNVENLFARAKALNADSFAEGEPALAAFGEFNRVAAKPKYLAEDKTAMLAALETLRVLVRTDAGLRRNPRPFDDAWALLRENRGEFLVAPNDAEPRIDAEGRGSWNGWVELIKEPVDEVATRMTAKVIGELGADVLCVVEAEDRPSLVRFNTELLGGQYGHGMMVDGNDPRGIDVGLFTTAAVDVEWVRSNVDTPHPDDPGRLLFSRDCPIYHLRTPGGADLFVLLNHLKSQSFAGGNPDPLRTAQAEGVRKIYDQLRAEGAELIAVLGDLNKGPDRTNPDHHPTLEALLDPGSPLVNAYTLPQFSQLFGDKDTDRERPGSFQSCSLTNRLDYILLSPELAAKVTDGGVFRKGLWGPPKNKTKPKLWSIYPEITASRHAASDHAAVWVDLAV
jgi:endonuclease/exonuclease/phosphatase family metal-dependent hydrolase